jgi:hypothetical protein
MNALQIDKRGRPESGTARSSRPPTVPRTQVGVRCAPQGFAITLLLRCSSKEWYCCAVPHGTAINWVAFYFTFRDQCYSLWLRQKHIAKSGAVDPCE